jgi:hypothetical protein
MILDIYDDLNPDSGVTLKKDDILEQVGSVPFDRYFDNSTVNLFEDLKRGDLVDVTVQRGGAPITVHWIYPGLTETGFLSRFFNVWWLAYIFWFVGMSTQLFMRPKDKRWLLFLASSYLTAMFIMLGSVSSFHIWWVPPSPCRLADHACLSPLSLDLPISAAHPALVANHLLQHKAASIAVGELFPFTPAPVLGSSFGIYGSVLLLILHSFQPKHRREVIFGSAACTALLL